MEKSNGAPPPTHSNGYFSQMIERVPFPFLLNKSSQAKQKEFYAFKIQTVYRYEKVLRLIEQKVKDSKRRVKLYTASYGTGSAKTDSDTERIRFIFKVKGLAYEDIDLAENKERRKEIGQAEELPCVVINTLKVGGANQIQYLHDFNMIEDVIEEGKAPKPIKMSILGAEYKKRCLNCNFARKTKNLSDSSENMVCSYCGAAFNFFVKVYS